MKKHILTFLIFTVLFGLFTALLFSLRGEVNYPLVITTSVLVGILTTILASRISKSGFFENKKKN